MSGEEPAESAACRALDGRCFGDLFDEGGCGLVWRSRDRAFCSVSSVCASKFIRNRSADVQASAQSYVNSHYRFHWLRAAACRMRRRTAATVRLGASEQAAQVRRLLVDHIK